MTSIALITGAAIGIGRATAKMLAARGDHVVVTDVLEDDGRSVVQEIRKAGGEAEFQHLDVRDTARANSVVKDIETRFGKIDTIVANAELHIGYLLNSYPMKNGIRPLISTSRECYG